MLAYPNRMRMKRLFSFEISNVHGSRIRRFAWLFGLISLVISCCLSYVEYQRQSERHAKQIHQMAFVLAEELDHHLQLYAYAVETLQTSAEQAIQGRIELSYRSVDYLVDASPQSGFSLNIPPQESLASIGNLTGMGDIPARDSPLAQEMDMALTLSPLFAKLVSLSPNIPWVYYTSAKHFVYLYPRVSPKEYFYQASLHRKPFFTGALPANNPARKTFWSPTYIDEGGKGLMVTVSKPIYLKGAFTGSVSVDVSLKTLSWILNHNTRPNTVAYLINQSGQVIASQKNDFVPLGQRLFVLDSNNKDRYFVEHISLRTSDWQIMLVTPKSEMMREALKNSSLYALAVFLVLICVFLIVWLSHMFYQVHAISMRDYLTGLYNRRSFEEMGKQELARARRFHEYIGLALIDIDYFKYYNDTYGHPAGDKALQLLAKFLTQHVSRASDNVFRIGGEEFALLSHVQSAHEFELLMQRLCQQLQDLAIEHSCSPELCLTISIGATIVDGARPVTLEQAVATADRALYRAKADGRNRAKMDFSDNMSQQT